MVNLVRQASVQSKEALVGHNKQVEFYPKCNEKPLKGTEHGYNIIMLAFIFFVIFFPFIFISWKLITLKYCSGFCHKLT